MRQPAALDRLNRWLHGHQPCPEIRWDEVVRVEAMGFDAIGPFEIALTFRHADGTEATLYRDTDGYDEVVASLLQRLPGVPTDWYQQMMSRPGWHVERVLYERTETGA